MALKQTAIIYNNMHDKKEDNFEDIRKRDDYSNAADDDDHEHHHDHSNNSNYYNDEKYVHMDNNSHDVKKHGFFVDLIKKVFSLFNFSNTLKSYPVLLKELLQKIINKYYWKT